MPRNEAERAANMALEDEIKEYRQNPFVNVEQRRNDSKSGLL
jgi:hypothetical protein